MQITKRKLFKSTVAKVMAVTMAVTMLPVPANANTEENTVTEGEGGTTEDGGNNEGAEAAPTPKYTALPAPTTDTNGENVIKLDGDVELPDAIAIKNKTIIDLNGHKINVTDTGSKETQGYIWVANELTIRDSSEEKTGIISKNMTKTSAPNETPNPNSDKEAAVIQSVKAESDVILEGGKIENNEGYGISASGGGKIHIKGGEVSSKYSTLSGNNTEGDMNLYISGGTLTSSDTPCIYMPSNLNLFIGKEAVEEELIKNGELTEQSASIYTDNAREPEFNGGIGVRMGNIKISGGTFNAMETDSKIASPAVSYKETGSVCFPDALFVIGGTYNASSGASSTNALNLDIKDATFNCKNGKGSAIAIYDFGLLNQDMTINIKGGAFNKTGENTSYGENVIDDKSREKRTSFDVLTLDNILPDGTDAAGGYNVKEIIEANEKAREIAISGGTFSKINNDKFPEYVTKASENDNKIYCIGNTGTKVTVGEHSLTGTNVSLKEATSSETGNIEYTPCKNNCDKVSITIDGETVEISKEDANLYLLELAAEGSNINVSFGDTVSEPAKLTESYGMYHNAAKFIVMPKAGYKIKTAPTFKLDDTSSNITDGTGIIKVEGTLATDGTKYTGTITTGSAFSASDTKNCAIVVSAETEAIPYKVSYKGNVNTVANATVTVKKNNADEDFVIGDNSTATIEDKITIKITPDTGYTLTVNKDDFPDADVQVNEDGSCTITYVEGKITNVLAIDLSKVTSNKIQYTVALPTSLVTAAKHQNVTASLDKTEVSALDTAVLSLVPDKGYEIVSANVTTAGNTCIISNMEDDKTDSRTKLITLSSIKGNTEIKTLEVVTKKSEYKLSYDTSGLLNATAVSKSGKLEDIILNFDSTDILTITPEKGYTLTDGISVKPVTEGACTVEPQSSSNGSQVFKISGLSGDCQVKVSGKAAPIEYTVSLDRTGLAEAEAAVTLKKDGGNFTTGGTANINSRLEVIITPKAGRAFKDIPVAEIDKNTDGIANAAIGTAIASNGSYTYTVYNFTGNTKITVSGTTEATSHSITMPSSMPALKNATALLDFTDVTDNGSANITITPETGFQIKPGIEVTLENPGLCTLSEPKAGANGTFVITLSDIKDDIKITSIKAEAEQAKIIEAGTDIATNIGGANLGDTFDLTGKTDDEKEEIENKQKIIIEAVKDTISEASTSSVIFIDDGNMTDDEKEALVGQLQEAAKKPENTIALSVEVKETELNEDTSNKVEEEIKNTVNAVTGPGVEVKSGSFPLDISLFAKVVGKAVDDTVSKLKTAVKDVQGKIKIKMEVPSSIPPKASDKTERKYYILRFHKDGAAVKARAEENSVTSIPCVYDEETNTISFESDKFSTYVLYYTDKIPKAPETSAPTQTPTDTPTGKPTQAPTDIPTEKPSQTPDSSKAPSLPNYIPSGIGGGSVPTPSPSASAAPSATPAQTATTVPQVTSTPSVQPSEVPGTEPSKTPSIQPSKTPAGPDKEPVTQPSKAPSGTVKTGKKVTVNGIKCTVTSTGKVKTVKTTGSKNAKSVVIPASVKISGKAYKVTAIADNAFKGSTKLTKVIIGANISKIGKNAFKGCSKLKQITIKTKKLKKGTVGKNAFKGINKKAVIKVPKGKVKSYKKIIKARGAKKSIKVK